MRFQSGRWTVVLAAAVVVPSFFLAGCKSGTNLVSLPKMPQMNLVTWGKKKPSDADVAKNEASQLPPPPSAAAFAGQNGTNNPYGTPRYPNTGRAPVQPAGAPYSPDTYPQSAPAGGDLAYRPGNAADPYYPAYTRPSERPNYGGSAGSYDGAPRPTRELPLAAIRTADPLMADRHRRMTDGMKAANTTAGNTMTAARHRAGQRSHPPVRTRPVRPTHRGQRAVTRVRQALSRRVATELPPGDTWIRPTIVGLPPVNPGTPPRLTGSRPAEAECPTTKTGRFAAAIPALPPVRRHPFRQVPLPRLAIPATVRATRGISIASSGCLRPRRPARSRHPILPAQVRPLVATIRWRDRRGMKPRDQARAENRIRQQPQRLLSPGGTRFRLRNSPVLAPNGLGPSSEVL